MNSIKKIIKQKAFETSFGIFLFYRVRVIREKLALILFSDLRYIEYNYKKRFSRDINLKNPKAYTEKLQWLKLFYRNNDMPICCDKYAVRDYLAQRGYEHILHDLIGIYKNAKKIDFESLPNSFVAKATHGSSWNLICIDKTSLNWKIWVKIMNSWMKLNLYVFGREWNYKNVPPQIIVEKFINQSPLIDYKFMCFNGEPKYLQINNEYKGKHYVDFYNINWEKEDFTYKIYTKSDRTIEKPLQFDEMFRLAQEISKPFPFARIDFYNVDNKIIFGEITFFPGGGLLPLIPIENKYDELLGTLLDLPEPNHNLELYNKINN